MPATGNTAAEQLLGHTLVDGWSVVEKLARLPGSTGGTFSVGYRVQHPDGRQGFLKAIDIQRILDQNGVTDTLRGLQREVECYNFERDVLQVCRDSRMSRVATALAHGSIRIPGHEPLHEVFYLVFDLADGDARSRLDASFEVVWCLRTLHHVATALRQLHWTGIAHQDLKPSNVLDYSLNGSRVGDFGRASRRGMTGPFDALRVAGDKGYAPPELLYGAGPSDWNARRLGCDTYLLGSLAYFFFTRASMTAAWWGELHPDHTPSTWGGSYSDVLPYLRQAFGAVLARFSTEVALVMPAPLCAEVVEIVRRLCEPDPALRGHAGARFAAASQFSMEQYVTKFDILARKATLAGLK